MIFKEELLRTFLTRLAEIGIYSVLVFVAILLFRMFFKKKATPALRFAMWLLLLLRLTVPFTLINVEIPIPQIVVQENTPKASETVFKSEDKTDITGKEQFSSAKTQNIPQESDFIRENAVIDENASSFPWMQILFVIWFAGILAFVLYRLWTLKVLKERLRLKAKMPDDMVKEQFEKLCLELNIRRKPSILVLDDVKSPALIIGLKPRMLIPTSLTEESREKERGFAIRHELMHVKRGDSFIMLWYDVLKCVWWFHPVVWLMEKSFRMDMESACDAKVVSGMDNDEKLFYATILIELGKEGI